VEHVHVHEGGQAIVGAVSQTGVAPGADPKDQQWRRNYPAEDGWKTATVRVTRAQRLAAAPRREEARRVIPLLWQTVAAECTEGAARDRTR